MTRIGSIVLILLFVGAMLRPVVPFLNYQVNRAYFAEVLCVNKDKPELKCNGKCHLKKQIKAQNEEENSSPKPLLRTLEKYPVCVASELPEVDEQQENLGRKNCYFLSPHSRDPLDQVFHPPQLSGTSFFTA